ncbi:isopeptide-forming domain-containing fimbrial protein [Collinsella aerofaciens]|uniref:isopeptide-forming domain-containing fimbrial protein n=1 Tax=Collinsella aerofaciens TaxID=74426 RepID=UPI001394B9B0|nr:isopeptide-forming domain-containing fimbrial protein [Collinsella aerofaciens]MZJ92132.1 isopeptide-forming domain-containing fimbrial protein [Collinsella aerofaciens]
MSMSKNIARLAVTAGLTAALSFGGVMAPVTMAFAEGNTTVTFSDPDYATSTTYKGIQIFKAKVTKDNGTTSVSGIEWAGTGTEIQTAVVNAIKKKDKNYSSDYAQDAADWLSAHTEGTGTDSKVASDNVFSLIAANLKDSTAWQKTNKGDASLSRLDAGYWLFLTDSADKLDGKSTDAFTSPVYAVIDGTNTTVEIIPKKSVPTVEKKILDDNKAKDDITTVPAADWDDVADSQIGQEVNYKLTGTVASNYATFDTYAYKFTDKLSTGLDYIADSAKVFALKGGTYTEISSENYTVTPADSSNENTLTVEFKVGDGDKGLKDVQGIDASTQIVVFYKAKLNKDVVIGNKDGDFGGNPNTVTLTYSNNPYGEGKGETIKDTAADFAFKLNLKKVDQGTEKGLGGAVFTIQSDDTNTKGQYVASEDNEDKNVVAGQLVTVEPGNLPDYVKFTSSRVSGKEGTIEVKGLDAGSYKVTEILTPDPAKYPTTADPFTFTIDATYDKTNMKVNNLAATVSETGRTDIAVGELDNSAGDNKLTGTQNGIDGATGLVTITVGNTKSVGLPLTGLNGVTFTWIAGGAVLCIGVAHLIRSRKQAEESEQE